MSKFKLLFGILLISVLFSSCLKTDDTEIQQPVVTYPNGVFIVNEGAYNGNNGDISFFNPETKQMMSNLYSTQNGGLQAGDVLQSFTIFKNKAYLVLNNSKKVEVVDLLTFKKIASISEFSYPRYFLPVSDTKAYLSNGNTNGTVHIINLTNNSKAGEIIVGTGPEMMAKVNDYVYVANSGGWGNNNTISVIDTKNDNVIKTITLDADDPVEMVIDADKNIWIICKGIIDYVNNNSTTDSKLVKINTTSNSVEKYIIIGSKNDTFVPTNISISLDGKTLFYVESNGVYKIGITETIAPANPLINGNFYGMDIHTKTGEIYVFESPSFTASGKMSIYKTDGSKIFGPQTVGIGPNAAVFN